MQREFGVLQVFVWTFIAALALITSYVVLDAVQPAGTKDLVTLGALQGLVYGLCAFFVWRWYAADKAVAEFLGIRRTHPLFAVIGLGLGVTLQAPADTLQMVVEWVAGPQTEEEIVSRALMLRTETELEAAMMMVSVACVIPLAEELLFRGALFGGLKRRHSSTVAAVLTGACFVVSHMQPRLWLPLAAVAAVLSLLRAVSGSVLPGFALHLGFNAVSLAVIVLGVTPVDRRLSLPWQFSLLGWALSAALVVWVFYLAKTSEADLARAEDDAV